MKNEKEKKKERRKKKKRKRKKIYPAKPHKEQTRREANGGIAAATVANFRTDSGFPFSNSTAGSGYRVLAVFAFAMAHAATSTRPTYTTSAMPDHPLHPQNARCGVGWGIEWLARGAFVVRPGPPAVRERMSLSGGQWLSFPGRAAILPASSSLCERECVRE